MNKKLEIRVKEKLVMPLLVICGLTSCSDIVEEPDISQDKVKIIAPADQTVVKGNVVNFTWEPVKDADSYLLQVASPDFDQASQVYVDSLMPTTTFAKELLPNDYQWRIKAVNSAYESLYAYSFFSVRKSDGFEGNTVLLSNPVNNYTTNQGVVTFSWEAVADAVEYQIQILDPSGAVIEDQVIKEGSASELTLTEGTFKWQVKATNGDKESTLYSTRTLMIDLSKPNTPQLTTPVDGSTQGEGETIFTWERENISGSTEIDSIFIYTDENQTDLYKKGVGSEKSYKTTLETGDYHWKVKSYDSAGNLSEDSNLFELIIN